MTLVSTYVFGSIDLAYLEFIAHAEGSSNAILPFTTANNGVFGKNANQLGVYGWAATNCVNDAGFPNPSTSCRPPADAPRAVNGTCKTPGALITDPVTKIQYCAEISNTSTRYPQGQCVSQRPGNVTGGTVLVTFKGFLYAAF